MKLFILYKTDHSCCFNNKKFIIWTHQDQMGQISVNLVQDKYLGLPERTEAQVTVHYNRVPESLEDLLNRLFYHLLSIRISMFFICSCQHQ